MQGKQRWLGWVAIGLGALALAVALLGRGFGPGVAAAGPIGANAPQAYAQRGPAQQGDQIRPGAQAQPDAGRQGRGPQGGQVAPGGEARGQGGRPGSGGFGIGGWLGLPFRMIGGLFQLGMLAALIVLGLWLIRGRQAAAAPSTVSAEPAQSSPPAPLSPTGEAYIEEPSDED
jgi:hypothetical protein